MCGVKDGALLIFKLKVESSVQTGVWWKSGPQQPPPNLFTKNKLGIFLLPGKHLGAETMNFRDGEGVGG